MQPKTPLLDEVYLRRKSSINRVAKDAAGNWTTEECMRCKRRFCPLIAEGMAKVETLTFDEYIDEIYRFTPTLATGSGSMTLKVKNNKLKVKCCTMMFRILE
eukprot:6002117-Amphidinium_carterae.1